jgi:hypothetical protein
MELVGTVVFGALIYAIPVVYAVQQWRALRRWRGGWRIAAGVPLVIAVFLTIATIVGFREQSNLWPLPLIFGLPVCMLILGAVAGLRRLAGAGGSASVRK